jgi:hypothetical protein
VRRFHVSAHQQPQAPIPAPREEASLDRRATLALLASALSYGSAQGPASAAKPASACAAQRPQPPMPRSDAEPLPAGPRRS